MLIITSGAYITDELATEFGKLPPSFLPLQNKRLFEHQLKIAGENRDVILSIPESFDLPQLDSEYLLSRGVVIVYVPEGITLGQSVGYVMKEVARYDEPLKILHGDTLFSELPDAFDIYTISKPADDYIWAHAIDNEGFIYTGYFAFSNQLAFLNSLEESGWNFVQSIILYKNLFAVREVIMNDWFDFGHCNTYYRSKSKMTTQREFNNLEIDRFSVKKYSSDSKKILAEANWYHSLPIPLKRYLPNLWDYGFIGEKGFYEIDYFYMSTLSELFTFGNNPYFIWERIINACNEFLLDCKRYRAPDSELLLKNSKKLYGEKTLGRLVKFSNKANINLDHKWVFNNVEVPSLREISLEMDSLISEPSSENITVFHGDFCFSNIFYCFRTHSIKVIDPRGIDVSGNQSIYGDIRYDVAKLAHSIIGLYDFIISGYFYYKEEKPYQISFRIPVSDVVLKIQSLYKKNYIAGFSLNDACTYPILVHLFLSMIPLHFDSLLKQKAMIANAIRLYLEFKSIQEDTT
jgi:hypothetical protein